MEKKIEVEINGKIVRVASHMVADMERFGAMRKTLIRKNIPKELLRKAPIIPAIIPIVENIEPVKVKQVRKPRTPKK